MDFTKDIYINKDKIYENSEIVILYKGFLFSNTLTDAVFSLGKRNFDFNGQQQFPSIKIN